jgi:hypothetical protein
MFNIQQNCDNWWFSVAYSTSNKSKHITKFVHLQTKLNKGRGKGRTLKDKPTQRLLKFHIYALI